MLQILLIFIGGGLGSLARFFVGKQFVGSVNGHFPIGTIVANILASLILGVFLGLEINNKTNTSYRAFIAIGFCGGFSTFSTFSADTFALIQSNRLWEALLNVVFNVVLCILATFVGIYLAK
jgi:fluoride exporter